MITIVQALKDATIVLKKDHRNLSPRLDCEVLLASLLHVDRSFFLIHGNERIDKEIYFEYQHYIHRRSQGEPVAYIIQKQEFMGLEFYVDQRVLIPRADTEILVETVIELCQNTKDQAVHILDVGTGSGVIGLSVANYVPWSKVVLLDISRDALDVAKLNAKTLHIDNVQFILGDCLGGIAANKFHFILSNPPYISTDDIPKLQREIQKFEPHIALDGGRDGLSYYRRIVRESKEYLLSGGTVVFEIGYDQGEEVMDLFNREGFKAMEKIKDLAGHDRVIMAKWA
ncbi:MAG: peptide chain release factor N(5)-glutamine methyltransferase [Eubacteriales bacterium]